MEYSFYEELLKQSIIAIGRTAPNPPVACIITDKKNILTSGATEPPGKRHAEIVALDELDRIQNLNSLSLSMYVTLEPCSTYGRTGPCILRIKNYKNIIKNIYIENKDPNLNLTGIKYLLENNFNVKIHPIFRTPHFALLPFFSAIQNIRPIYIIKLAIDKTGFLGSTKKSISITGKLGKYITMLLRSKVDGVIVGPGTTVIDEPSLDLRFHEFDSNFYQKYSSEIDKVIKKLKKQLKKQYLNLNHYYDEFLRGIIIFHKDIVIQTKYFSYQPKRIFILGRYFDNFIKFYNKQKKISENVQQSFYFIIQENYKKDFPLDYIEKNDYVISPSLSSKEFNKFLDNFLINIQVHRVLIEAGQKIFSIFYNNLTIDDRIYLIENQSILNNVDIPKNPQEKKYFDRSNYNLYLYDKITINDLIIYSYGKI